MKIICIIFLIIFALLFIGLIYLGWALVDGYHPKYDERD